ncbi:hypothetical protein GGI35DRAFT_436952 [Trichoderma velutinum]
MAQVGSIRAQCQTTSAIHQSMRSPQQENETYASAYNPEINVVLTRGSPYTYVNFTSGGAFVNGTQLTTGNLYLNTVDCLLTYGSLNITQDGTKAPVIVSKSYQQNTSSIRPYPIAPIRRIYTESYYRSPYYFTAASGTGDTADSLYSSAVGTLLLSPKANSSAEQVAKRMQDIFDTATLMAFVRSPGAANVTITNKTTDPLYVFHSLNLLVLLIPALAFVFGTYMRWRVENNVICSGYDPVEIARRGPVWGMDQWDGNQVANNDGECDRMRVKLSRVENAGDKASYQLEVIPASG